MAKRGRKPKERKGYFYEIEEQAIVQYINEEDVNEKNRIFNNVLYPALTKMIESIIRRYKLFVPDEDFEQNFNDTISYLLTKISHFKPVITGYDLIEDENEIKKYEYVTLSEELLKQKIRDAKEDDPDYIVVYFGLDESDDEFDIEKKYYMALKNNISLFSISLEFSINILLLIKFILPKTILFSLAKIISSISKYLTILLAVSLLSIHNITVLPVFIKFSKSGPFNKYVVLSSENLTMRKAIPPCFITLVKCVI